MENLKDMKNHNGRRAFIRNSGVALTASSRFRGRVQLAAPITGNGTMQQMARLQGATTTQWWEQGEYEVQYVKVRDEWKIHALHYRKA